MTIITKPISEKKEGKLILPLVENEQIPSAPGNEDVEGQTPDPAFIILRARARRVSTTTTLCLLLTAFMVVGVGIFGGTYLYRQYLRSQIFKGKCSFLLNQDGESAFFVNNKIYDEEDPIAQKLRDIDDYNMLNDRLKNNNLWINEEFELDLDNDDYEKIDVPNFRDGRKGTFVHDFNNNITGIIDVAGHRCFVMPLNRENVLPPKSLFDLMDKMWKGYYKVDTEIVRETMRVVTPRLTDYKDIGDHLVRECGDFPIYRLESYVNGVVKRSTDLHKQAKFAQFSGKGILEFDIVGLNDLEEYEKELGQ